MPVEHLTRYNTDGGTAFGQDASDKIAFYGATAVVRPAAVPAASTDATTAIALVNDIRTKLITLGLLT